MKNIRTFWCLLTGVSVLLLCGSCGNRKPSVKEQRAEKRRIQEAELVQQRQTLQYCDSMQAILFHDVDELMKNFTYVKEDRYEDHGHYVHKQLGTTRNAERCFLQPYVSDDYRITLRSYYFGTRKIRHTSVTLTADSVVLKLSGKNHDFETFTAEEEDNVEQHEVVTLSDEDCVSLLGFVDAYRDRKIKVTLEGKGRYVYVLSKEDRNALLDTYQLGVLMCDIRQMEMLQKQASLKVQNLEKRLGK